VPGTAVQRLLSGESIKIPPAPSRSRHACSRYAEALRTRREPPDQASHKIPRSQSIRDVNSRGFNHSAMSLVFLKPTRRSREEARPERNSHPPRTSDFPYVGECRHCSMIPRYPPLRGTSFGSVTPCPMPLFSLSTRSQAEWQGGDIMECIRCQGLMVEDQFFDLEGTQGFMWMKGWRCRHCGHAPDPLREANRRLLEATMLV
jgi:hypothetical protein